MTKTTDSGLICLTGKDYAAVALAEQCSAAQADSSLLTLNTGLTAYNNRPWATAVTTASATSNNTLNDFVLGTQPSGGVAVSSLAHSTTAFGLSGLPTMTVPPAGWYLAGATCTFQTTGAVSANTRRDLILTWSYAVNGINQWDQQSVHSTYESNTGADAATVTGMFFADGLRNYLLLVNFVHKNTASTMQVNTGARYWVQYLGTGLVI
jgi:hypothetical protein